MTQINPENIKAGDEVQIDGSPNWREVHCAAGTFFNVVFGSEYPIVSVELITAHRPGFDWKDVKWGMCFKFEDDGDNLLFLGNHLNDDEKIWVFNSDGNPGWYYKNNLTRHPAGDIKDNDNDR